jgi:imidazolonepropionase-like amidohydrolase
MVESTPVASATKEDNKNMKYCYFRLLVLTTISIALVLALGCQPVSNSANLNAHPSTYQVKDYPPVIIRNINILDGLGAEIESTDILLEKGKIKQIGQILKLPKGGIEVDGTGRYLTPGIVDVHTHYGTASLPYAHGDPDNWDVNEASHPISPEIRIENAFNPQDPSIFAALRAGVTTFQVLPGSRNLIGGLGVVMKNVPNTTAQAMKFPNAPYGLKMACGENPKAYGSEKRAPYSRMGSVSLQREAWRKAKAYKDKFWTFNSETNEGLATLAAVLDGLVKVHVHCYRADDMATMIDMAHEFGFAITAFHHAVEAYKIPKLLANENICSAVWSDWWGWKIEAYDGIPQNAAFINEAGACLVIHSDIPALGTRLNIEAAKALAAGRSVGLDISKATALTWITSVPAKLLGVESQIGSIALGMNADVVIWSDDPFSVYGHPDQVYIDGVLIYDTKNIDYQPKSDVLVGQFANEVQP